MRTLSIVIALLWAAHLGLLFVHPTGLAAEAAAINPQGTQGIPSQFVQMIPYVLTIIALAGVVGKSTPPAALGRGE